MLGRIAQGRIHFHNVQGHEGPRLVHALANEMAFSEGESAADGRARGGTDGRVEGIDVKAQVNGPVRAQVGEGHLDDLSDAKLVDVVHRVRADLVFFEDGFFAGVEVAEPNVAEPGGMETAGGEPG